MSKVALVTGASTGIGYAIVQYLLTHKYIVYAGARKEKDLAQLKSLGAIPLLLDVTDESQMAQALKDFSSQQKGLDVLVNNAGIAIVGPAELVPIEKYREQFDVNVFGLISVTQKFLPYLRQNKGHIINISSIAGRFANAMMSPYSASKFAVEGFSDSLRRELKFHEVKVTLIEPGPVATPIWEKSHSLNEGTLVNADSALTKIYEKPIEKFRQETKQAEQMAVDVQEVIQALDHALTSGRPRTRYLVGRPAKIAGFLSWLLPDKLVDRLIVGKIY